MDPRAQRTLASLQHALMDLAGTMPPADIDVSALCRHAGVHRTTFYKHFDSVAELAGTLVADLLTRITSSSAPGTADTEEYAGWLTALVGHVVERRHVYGTFLGPDGDPAVVRSVCDSLIRQAEKAAARAARQDVPPEGATVDVDVKAAARVLGFSSYGLLESVLLEEHLDIPATVEAFIAGLPVVWRPVLN
jgi:AcrR family transcriptional regulator